MNADFAVVAGLALCIATCTVTEAWEHHDRVQARQHVMTECLEQKHDPEHCANLADAIVEPVLP